MIKRCYSINKSRKILHQGFSVLKRKSSTLNKHVETLENLLKSLEKSIFEKDKIRANELAREVEAYIEIQFKKPLPRKAFEVFISILIALLIATVVRQTWFELYEIPTGSMRPSFREQDRLSVTKTAFGINIPLKTGHLYFNPDLVERGKVVIFSGDNLDLPDTDTTYFGILPYKKRYIKRMIGKPGDSLFFYGGEIYGVDKEGNPINELLNDPWMKKNEHIPFINFEGKTVNISSNQILLKQMNIPIGRYTLSPFTGGRGEVHNGIKWIEDNPTKKEPKINTYGDLWGIKNFGMARLLTKKQLQKFTNIDTHQLEVADLYLEIRHNPNLKFPEPSVYNLGNRIDIRISTFDTIIPLEKRHIDSIMDNMYTARFDLKNGFINRHKSNETKSINSKASLPQVEDGTYEFYSGKAEKVVFQGKTKSLPVDHQIYSHEPENVQTLFNFGIEMYNGFNEDDFYKFLYPNRYVYFRNGDLYLMGAKIMDQSDPVLKKFVKNEEKKEQTTKYSTYLAFKDFGPPIKNGELDVNFIKTFGITIPEKYYLVLGDNHAMSADSRVFGFVHEDNLEGSPSWILWPTGNRWGLPPQSQYPVFNTPRTIVWITIGIILLIYFLFHRKKMQKRLFLN